MSVIDGAEELHEALATLEPPFELKLVGGIELRTVSVGGTAVFGET
jgi:hypothetical protein